jgi:hypothetical protein
MRKAFSATTFILVFLLTAVAGTQLVSLADANGIFVSPDSVTEPPTITILKTVVNGNNVTINVKANIGKSATASPKWTMIETVSYVLDSNPKGTYVYRYYNPNENKFDIERRIEISCALNLTAIPDGNHTITICADEMGFYESMGTFHITGFSSVNFTVDTLPPKVTVLPVENIAYDSPDTALNFTVSEPASKIAYSLDGQDNVTVDGNTTLTGLAAGAHNVTVYVWDAAGNVGASETITFRVEPFPVVPVAAAFVASVAVVSMALLVYLKKRRH